METKIFVLAIIKGDEDALAKRYCDNTTLHFGVIAYCFRTPEKSSRGKVIAPGIKEQLSLRIVIDCKSYWCYS